MKEIFKYIKANQFFANYAKGVKSYKDKMQGVNRHGTKIDFTPEDRKAIIEGLKKMFADLKKLPKQ